MPCAMTRSSSTHISEQCPLPEPEPVLRVDALVAGYVPGVDILAGIDLRVYPREIVTVVGPNGAGKSTLLKAICGLLRPSSGAVFRGDTRIDGLRPHRIARSGVGYVPQRANVFVTMTIDENLDLGALPFPGVDSARRRAEIFELFPRLRDRRRQYAGTLSGGERQMLAIAKTLMAEPSVLLLDEPSAGVAPLLVELIFEKALEINAAGTTILMVEQNARRALALSHRGYVLDLGRNRFEGTGADLLRDPRVADLYLGGAARVHNPDAALSVETKETP
jgi:branched-chain amino acid transport system ATP-binding protein